VHAPVNGYVTNLVLDVGDYADAGKPVLAVVDQDSFRVEAYLEETKLNFVRIGDLAVVTPLSGAPPIKGEVDSIARGIGDTQNPTGSNWLQNVNAIFEWVRLAQRIPVRIKRIDVPKDTILSSGHDGHRFDHSGDCLEKGAHCGDPMSRARKTHRLCKEKRKSMTKEPI
jgi:multidrug resistance efflux pump